MLCLNLAPRISLAISRYLSCGRHPSKDDRQYYFANASVLQASLLLSSLCFFFFFLSLKIFYSRGIIAQKEKTFIKLRVEKGRPRRIAKKSFYQCSAWRRVAEAHSVHDEMARFREPSERKVALNLFAFLFAISFPISFTSKFVLLFLCGC